MGEGREHSPVETTTGSVPLGAWTRSTTNSSSSEDREPNLTLDLRRARTSPSVRDLRRPRQPVRRRRETSGTAGKCQSKVSANATFMKLFWIDAVKRASAERVTAIVRTSVREGDKKTTSCRSALRGATRSSQKRRPAVPSRHEPQSQGS